MAWDLNSHSSLTPGIFLFSALGGSRCNHKSMHFGVRQSWITGLECTVGVVTDTQEAPGRDR